VSQLSHSRCKQQAQPTTTFPHRPGPRVRPDLCGAEGGVGCDAAKEGVEVTAPGEGCLDQNADGALVRALSACRWVGELPASPFASCTRARAPARTSYPSLAPRNGRRVVPCLLSAQVAATLVSETRWNRAGRAQQDQKIRHVNTDSDGR
jgi:hypothetical protein